MFHLWNLIAGLFKRKKPASEHDYWDVLAHQRQHNKQMAELLEKKGVIPVGKDPAPSQHMLYLVEYKLTGTVGPCDSPYGRSGVYQDREAAYQERDRLASLHTDRVYTVINTSIIPED